MTPKSAFWKWAFLGCITATLLLVAQSAAVGGPEGLLQVGETSLLREVVEGELGEIPLKPGPGHDGHVYYAIALDPSGYRVAESMGHAGYRYRRILFPLVSSLGGILGGSALLYSMIAWTILSAGVASGVTAAIAVRWSRSEWITLAVLLNPGVWLSIRLLTADTLALALMVVGLFYVTSRFKLATGSFALSVLAKDVFLLTPVGLAVSKERRRWLLPIISGALLLGWSLWLEADMGTALSPRGNLAIPFTGIVRASDTWPSMDFGGWLYLGFAMIVVIGGLLRGVIHESWLRWPILTWSLVAVVSSQWVWNFGNNAARVFAPLAVLIALSYVSPPHLSPRDTSTRHQNDVPTEQSA